MFTNKNHSSGNSIEILIYIQILIRIKLDKLKCMEVFDSSLYVKKLQAVKIYNILPIN